MHKNTEYTSGEEMFDYINKYSILLIFISWDNVHIYNLNYVNFATVLPLNTVLQNIQLSYKSQWTLPLKEVLQTSN